MTVLTIFPEQFIFAQNNQLKTNSVKVAEAFGKLHKNIIQKIESLDCSKGFTELNFQPSEYTDSTGRKLPAYEMTKDGFMFLVMGFTGKQAAGIKEAYINAFNVMYERLFARQPELKTLPPTVDKLSPAQQRHIQNRISELVKAQAGTTHASLYGQIKNKFQVGTYKDVLQSQYPALCQFLVCEPLADNLPATVITFTKQELQYHDELVASEAVKRVQGELLQKPEEHKLSLSDLQQLFAARNMSIVDNSEFVAIPRKELTGIKCTLQLADSLREKLQSYLS